MNIITFHYVRDPSPPFEGLKAFGVDQFEYLLDRLVERMTPVDLGEAVAWASGDIDLPSDAFLLTFDDGFADHRDTVVPRLDERGLRGVFFAIEVAAEGARLLPVHQIQHLLASGADPTALLARFDGTLEEHRRSGVKLPTQDEMWSMWGCASRFDPAEIMLLKRALGGGLPEAVCTSLRESLFSEFVTHDAASLAEELYLDADDLRSLIDGGHRLGAHGVNHLRLAEVPHQTAEDELEGSMRFLGSLCPDDQPRTIAYPYGSVNAAVSQAAACAGFDAGFTTEPRVADRAEPLLLARFDANDLDAVVGAGRSPSP